MKHTENNAIASKHVANDRKNKWNGNTWSIYNNMNCHFYVICEITKQSL
jgi:hypothetical protein